MTRGLQMSAPNRDQQLSTDAQRALNDTHWDWLRPLPRRRRLVAATGIAWLLYAVSTYSGWDGMTLPALLAFGALLFALRRATRTITDLREVDLDERLREVRGRVYRQCYLGAMTLFSVLFLMAIGTQLAHRWLGTALWTHDQWLDLTMALFFAALALPSATFAWRERYV